MIWVIIIAIAVFWAFSIGILITSVVLLKSNDIGDSKGGYKTFTDKPLELLEKRDRIPRNYF